MGKPLAVFSGLAIVSELQFAFRVTGYNGRFLIDAYWTNHTSAVVFNFYDALLAVIPPWYDTVIWNDSLLQWVRFHLTNINYFYPKSQSVCRHSVPIAKCHVPALVPCRYFLLLRVLLCYFNSQNLLAW
jgi:hypothetical protein